MKWGRGVTSVTRVTQGYASPRIEGYKWRVGAAGPPHFERNTIKVRCEKVVFFSPTCLTIFGDFFDVFFKLPHLLNDFASKPNEISTHFAPNEILAEITKSGHLI